MADGSQYLIDIAAEMNGGDSAISQLNEMAESVTGVGTTLEQLDNAVAQAETALAGTASASAAAADALKAGEQKYAQLERAAIKAAKAVERASIKGGKQANMHILARNAHLAAQAVKAEAAQVDKLSAKLKTAEAAHARAGKAMKNLQSAAKGARDALPVAEAGNLATAFATLGGPLGESGARIFEVVEGGQQLKTALGAGGAQAALAAVTVAALTLVVVALTAAFVAGTIAVGAWAVRLADARQQSALTTQALEATNAELVGLGSYMLKIARDTGQSADALRGLAVQLKDAGVAAADMPAALRAVAIAETALGQGGGAQFVAQLKAGKKSVGELAREVDAKLGGIAAKRMSGLEGISKRLKLSLADTFGGLEIDGLLSAAGQLVEMFGQGHALGRTLKFLFESFFQPLVNAAAQSIPIVEAFLIGLATGALKVFIALKPAIAKVKELAGLGSDSSLASTLEMAGTAAEYLVYAIVGGVALAAAAFAGLVSAAAVMVGPMVAVGALIAAGLGKVYGAATAVITFLGSISLSSIGSQMVAGLAKGITSGAAAVLKAITGVVSGGISAAKSLLGIKSPSRVFAGIGANTAEGFAQGVEKADRAPLEALVAPPVAAKAEAGASTGGGRTINLSITVNASGDGQSIADQVADAVLRLFEGDLDPAGAPA